MRSSRFVRAQWPRTSRTFSDPGPVIAAQREVANAYATKNPARRPRAIPQPPRATNMSTPATWADIESGR